MIKRPIPEMNPYNTEGKGAKRSRRDSLPDDSKLGLERHESTHDLSGISGDSRLTPDELVKLRNRSLSYMQIFYSKPSCSNDSVEQINNPSFF